MLYIVIYVWCISNQSSPHEMFTPVTHRKQRTSGKILYIIPIISNYITEYIFFNKVGVPVDFLCCSYKQSC